MKSISPSAMDSSLITRRVVCRAPRGAVVPEIYVHPIKSRYNRPHGRGDRRQRIGPSARARAPRPRRARVGARRSEREQGGDEGRAPGRPRRDRGTLRRGACTAQWVEQEPARRPRPAHGHEPGDPQPGPEPGRRPREGPSPRRRGPPRAAAAPAIAPARRGDGASAGGEEAPRRAQARARAPGRLRGQRFGGRPWRYAATPALTPARTPRAITLASTTARRTLGSSTRTVRATFTRVWRSSRLRRQRAWPRALPARLLSSASCFWRTLIRLSSFFIASPSALRTRAPGPRRGSAGRSGA